MIYAVEWPDEVVLPAIDARNTWSPCDPYSAELPADGFPRITGEGVEVLKEGMHGDFTRWAWGIGNHPMELPSKYLRNCHIRAMKDRPHFYIGFWYGLHYPQTKRNLVLTPWYCFDQLDLNESVTDRTTIALRQSSDYWSHLSLLLDDKEVCAT